MKARLRKLEDLFGVHEPRPCPTCRGGGRVQFFSQFVTDDTPQAEEYFENDDTGEEPSPPCATCGKTPLRIFACCYQPVIKPKGAPESDEDRFMTTEESDAWRAARGEPTVFAPGSTRPKMMCEQAGM